MRSNALYGINFFKTDNVSPLAKQVLTNGFAVIKNFLSPAEIEYLKLKSELLLTEQEGHWTDEQLNNINEKNILRAPLLRDKFFLEKIFLNDKFLILCRELLGENFQIHLQNVIFNRPHQVHNQSKWHRDIPYQTFIPSNPFSLSFMVALTPFNVHNGGTRVLPCSHRWIDETDFDLTTVYTPDLEAGDVLIFDSFLIHSAGENKSGEARIGINNMVTTPILKQQIDLTGYSENMDSESELIQKILGHRWQVPASVNDYRSEKLKKLKN